MTLRVAALLLAQLVCCAAGAFEYSVRRPSATLRPTWFAKDTRPGVWTLNYEDALARAKATGAYSVLMFTGSWWCPYCETLESMVLKSKAWSDYVADRGLYLAMADFPYRNEVPADQAWKGCSELGAGWGFKCWMTDPDYLEEIGLSAAEGRQVIEKMYAFQNGMAAPGAARSVFRSADGKGTIEVAKVGYPTLVVFDRKGRELGRVGFPWFRTSDVTGSEAQEYVIQSIERLIVGECVLCSDALVGDVPADQAQTYLGWVSDAAAGISGTLKLKAKRKGGDLKVSASMNLGGVRRSFRPVTANGTDGVVLTSGDGLVLQVGLGRHGLSGTLRDGSRTYFVSGGRDVFKVRDAEAVQQAESAPRGVWSIVLENAASGEVPSLARGFGALSVELKAKGRARIAGYLGDGTRVGVRAQAIVGENGVSCLPVWISRPSGSLGFVVWFKNGRIISFSDTAPWRGGGAEPFVSTYTIRTTMAPGQGSVPGKLDFLLSGFDADESLGVADGRVAVDPSEDVVSVDGRIWTGTDRTSFKATVQARTGVMKGSLVFRTVTPDGKARKVKGRFFGIVMGGGGYGTAVVGGVGSWPVRIVVCGSCSL